MTAVLSSSMASIQYYEYLIVSSFIEFNTTKVMKMWFLLWQVGESYYQKRGNNLRASYLIWKMDSDDSIQSEMTAKGKKPGPRRSKCIWCGSTECNHCRCTGQTGCNHRKGEMCPNARYKRRLVCNSCEKNKLKEKNHRPETTSGKRKRQRAASKASKKRTSPSSSVSGSASKKATSSTANGKNQLSTGLFWEK